jgi:Flp pilus assembly CpaE family ATPase
MRVWTKMDKFILVSTLSVGSARRAAQIISLRSKINSGDTKSNVLLNKVGSDSDIPQSDYEAAIGQKIWKATPYDVDIDAAILAGSSLVETKKHSKFTRAVTGIVSEMTDISNNVSQGFMESLWTTFKKK